MPDPQILAQNDAVSLAFLGSADSLWTYTIRGTAQTYRIGAPSFEIDGQLHIATLSSLEECQPPLRLANGSIEYRYEGMLDTSNVLRLELVLHVPEHNPVVRWQYILKSQKEHTLTKTHGHDTLTYLSVDLEHASQVTELQLANFNEQVHSYSLSERPVEQSHFANSITVAGPIIYAGDARHQFLIAYEHGATIPDAFVQFRLTPDHRAVLHAVKGSYVHGQPLNPTHAYTTIWFDFAALVGDRVALATTFRTFVLKHMSLQAESRKPYIFYNTWNRQERHRWWHGGAYLDPLYEHTVLAEIDAAHNMGIDVFVIDTGWYSKTGDWRVNTNRFSADLKILKARLDSYNMKLGLWFGPTSAALSSEALRLHPEDRQSWHGQFHTPYQVWETEESVNMCLVSSYSDHFADELIRLAHEVGVRYFKWDAVGQYGCDDPRHWHGTDANSEQERSDSYAFQLGQQLTRIVERVCAAIPDAIVDFDVTESGRYVGLGFLAAGKYFLINNGPYNQNYDLPLVPGQQNDNLFFFPGQARGWIVRTPLSYDEWIPSILFLTHNFPDDPATSQLTNLAATLLGYNGIWGELTNVSAPGVELIHSILARYKVVRDDITSSAAIRTGLIGTSPEVYEKISPETGRGLVVCFASHSGTYTYITRHPTDTLYWHTDGTTITHDPQHRAILEITLSEPGAHIIFFGIN